MKVTAALIWHELKLFLFPNGDRLIIRPPWLRLKYMFQCRDATSWWTWTYWAECKAESLLGIDLSAQPHNAQLTVYKRKDQSSWWEILVWFVQINYKGEPLELRWKMETEDEVSLDWEEMMVDSGKFLEFKSFWTEQWMEETDVTSAKPNFLSWHWADRELQRNRPRTWMILRYADTLYSVLSYFQYSISYFNGFDIYFYCSTYDRPPTWMGLVLISIFISFAS